MNPEQKEYKREALIRIDKNDSYLVNFSESKILEKKFGAERINNFSFCNLTHLYFYHYGCESVDDTNWGCAWRSLQSALRFQLSLSNQTKDISFYNLFMKYGPKNTLIEIFKKMCKKENKDELVDILSKRTFAPFENQSGWAEPFISQLALYDFGFDCFCFKCIGCYFYLIKFLNIFDWSIFKVLIFIEVSSVYFFDY